MLLVGIPRGRRPRTLWIYIGDTATARHIPQGCERCLWIYLGGAAPGRRVCGDGGERGTGVSTQILVGCATQKRLKFGQGLCGDGGERGKVGYLNFGGICEAKSVKI